MPEILNGTSIPTYIVSVGILQKSSEKYFLSWKAAPGRKFLLEKIVEGCFRHFHKLLLF